jgi:hypothetical protein
LPTIPKVILIEGTWREGKTVRDLRGRPNRRRRSTSSKTQVG